LQPDEEDFRADIRRAGIAIPLERYEVMLAAYRDFQAAMKLLDVVYSYADEPATGMHLVPAS
jgi:hypothetical protein